MWKAEPQASETGDLGAPVAQTGHLGGGSRRKQFGGRGRRGFPIRDTLSGSSGGPWARGSSQMSWSPLRGEEGRESASSLPHSGWHSWVARPYPPAAWSVPSLLWSCGPFIFPGSSEWQQLNYLISVGETAIPRRASAGCPCHEASQLLGLASLALSVLPRASDLQRAGHCHCWRRG